jgi:SAM-dependent methyltransferase
MTLNQSDYVLGHTDIEQLRLIRQARILAPFTQHFLRDAGIVPGMRVLDIGCGMGDVTMLAAGLVGRAGDVVSIDMDQASVETARRRASAAGLNNATFLRAEISSFADAKPFDAIVGRLVLEFLPETTAIISRLCGLLKPSGIIALQEPTWKIWLACTAHLPLRTAVTTLIRDTFLAGGVNTEMGLPLYQGFLAANFGYASTCRSAIVPNSEVCSLICFFPSGRAQRHSAFRWMLWATRRRWPRGWMMNWTLISPSRHSSVWWAHVLANV